MRPATQTSTGSVARGGSLRTEMGLRLMQDARQAASRCGQHATLEALSLMRWPAHPGLARAGDDKAPRGVCVRAWGASARVRHLRCISGVTGCGRAVPTRLQLSPAGGVCRRLAAASCTLPEGASPGQARPQPGSARCRWGEAARAVGEGCSVARCARRGYVFGSNFWQSVSGGRGPPVPWFAEWIWARKQAFNAVSTL